MILFPFFLLWNLDLFTQIKGKELIFSYIKPKTSLTIHLIIIQPIKTLTG